MLRITLISAALFMAFRSATAAETAPCVADTQINQYAKEQELNSGARTHLRVKANEAYAIFKFDLSKYAGKKCSGGKLSIYNVSDTDLVIDRVSTIAVDWEEGTGNWEANAAGANWTYAAYDSKKWSDGGDFLSVTFGKGGSMLNSKGGSVKANSRGFVDLDAEFMQALIDGKQFGIALSSANNANTDVYSREQNSEQPGLIIFVGEAGAAEAKKSWTAYSPPKVNEADWMKPVKCIAVADAAILASGGEENFSSGGKPQLKLKGIEDQILLKFDVSALKGMTIERARLYMKKTEQCKLITLGVSTIAADWVEGHSADAIEAGASCFSFRKYPEDPANPKPDDYWAGSDSNFLTVAQGEGHTLSCYSNVFEGEKPDWICVDVAPRVVQDLIAYEQYGLIVSEEKGQRAFAEFMMDDGAHTNENPNHFVFTRDQNAESAAYLIVSGKAVDKMPPAPIEKITTDMTDHGRRLEPGHLKLKWIATGDDGKDGRAFAYDVRYSTSELNAGNWQTAEKLPRFQIIRPGISGSEDVLWIDILKPGQTYYFAVSVLDEAGNASAPAFASAAAAPKETVSVAPAPKPEIREGSPAAGGGLTVWAFPDVNKVNPLTGGMMEDNTYMTGPTPAHNGNLVWDGKERKVRLAGCSNEFVAFQFAIEPDDTSKPVEASIDASDIGPVGKSNVRLFREWFVKGNDAYFPDPLLPLDNGKLTIPAQASDKPETSNVIPGQKLGLVFIDVYIPHKTAPGTYTGTFTINSVKIPLELTVYNFELPDTIDAIIFELNNYSGWAGEYGNISDDQLAELEWNYQRLAHEHRLTFNSVNHGHTLTQARGVAPVISGQGKDMRVSDWAAWDKRYGPMLDGSAFNDCPRKGVPITHIYLPFFESWPASLPKEFTYDISKEMLGTFSQKYQDEMKAVSGEFMKHFNQKKWFNTEFQFFMNNKNYYFVPLKNRQGTYWLLDEPMHRDDYLALNYVASLWREGALPYKGSVKAGFRADVSRPEWMRDYLDKNLDIFDGGYEYGFKKNHVDRQCRRHDESFNGPRQVWTYGGANDPSAPNLSQPAWILKSYLAGIKGMLPWLTEGDSWEKADGTCVVYCGHRFEKLGPYPSLRLKAMRRGQQDAEYANLLEKRLGCLRSKTRVEILKFMKLDSKLIKTSSEDAGVEKFDALDAASFEQLRRTVAVELAKASGQTGGVQPQLNAPLPEKNPATSTKVSTPVKSEPTPGGAPTASGKGKSQPEPTSKPSAFPVYSVIGLLALAGLGIVAFILWKKKSGIDNSDVPKASGSKRGAPGSRRQR